MANTDNPCGFKPMNMAGLRPPTKYRIAADYSEDIFIGQPVSLSGGYAIIATAGTDNTLLGIAAYFENITQGMKGGGYYPDDSSDEWVVYVWDDPHTRFIAQDDGAGNDIALTDIGNTGNFIGTHAGNTDTNISGAELDGSSFDAGQAVTDQFRLVDLVDKPGNDVGDNAEWVVEIHNHVYRQESNVDATS